MQFHSFNYVFIFLPLVLILYYLGKNSFNRNITLIVASYTFYSWGNPYLALLLLSSSCADYFVGKKMHGCNVSLLETSDQKITAGLNRRKNYLLIFSLAFNLGLLAIFKYWDWAIDMIHFYLYANTGLELFNLKNFKHLIGVPPGISFYTFQTLSYTIDIYRRQFSPKGNFTDYLTFVAFFPQLIAGPIERARDLLPQLAKLRKSLSGKIAESAFFLISWGLFKKVVFADNIGHLVRQCHDEVTQPGMGFLMAFAFAFQIYCDFSAYSDIARGTARLFGVRLKRNFLTPYFAINPSDFWKRWHISLSSWVRDYVYIPLGGNRSGEIKNVVNLLFTLFLMGLWHGAGKYFILWGIYHFSLLMFYRVFPLDKHIIKYFGDLWGRVVAISVMFTFTLLGWLIFYAKSRVEVSDYIKSFIGIKYFITNIGAIPAIFYELGYGVLLYAAPIIITECIGFRYKREFVDIHKFIGTKAKAALYILMFYAMLNFSSRGDLDFLYFQF
jgi:alginate O-acetyltransferase complex protein AlgI